MEGIDPSYARYHCMGHTLKTVVYFCIYSGFVFWNSQFIGLGWDFEMKLLYWTRIF